MWITVYLGLPFIIPPIIIRCMSSFPALISFISVKLGGLLEIICYSDEGEQGFEGSLGDAINAGKVGRTGEGSSFLSVSVDASDLPTLQPQSFEGCRIGSVRVKGKEFVHLSFFLIIQGMLGGGLLDKSLLGGIT